MGTFPSPNANSWDGEAFPLDLTLTLLRQSCHPPSTRVLSHHQTATSSTGYSYNTDCSIRKIEFLNFNLNFLFSYPIEVVVCCVAEVPPSINNLFNKTNI